MSLPRVLCVIGTRPEAIKMAPVVQALRKRRDLSVRLLLTGQHSDLLHQALATFGLSGDIDLDVMRRDQSLSGLTSRILEAMDPLLLSEAPSIVLAQGDTTTVMGTAIACFHRQIPFGHVEAGLRTGNILYPFPEEFNRIVASRAACLNFAPTEGARQALLRENVPSETIYVTGNTVIDALFAVSARMEGGKLATQRDPCILMTMHRRENFGAPAKEIFEAVKALCSIFPRLHFIYPVHPNPKVFDLAHAMLGGNRQVRLTAPLSYHDLVRSMSEATLVLTDSGGLQEEAPALGKPVLVLRNETERPEAVELGVAKLVGTQRDTIVTEVSRLLTDHQAYRAMAKGCSPYGDGRAAERIATLVSAKVLGLRTPEGPDKMMREAQNSTMT
jgi:UDP-N-acetylglucosamine 2-epimerase (non-hydrolysing)